MNMHPALCSNIVSWRMITKKYIITLTLYFRETLGQFSQCSQYMVDWTQVAKISVMSKHKDPRCSLLISFSVLLILFFLFTPIT